MNKTFLHEGKKIFYRVEGNGKPVILVHGFGEDGTVWKNQLAFLKPDYKVIIPDLPGSGKSEIIDDMSMEGLAEVIHAIIHEEDIDRCPVIGHSMGGYITLALAEKYYNHLNSIGLFHSTTYSDSEEKKVARRKGIDFIKEHGSFEFLKTSIPNLFSPVSKAKMAERIGEFIEAQRNFKGEALVSYYEAMISRPERTAILNHSWPVLFIMGKYDNAVPMADSLQQCHLPEKSYIHILHQSAHMGMLEEQENSNLFLAEFLETLETSGQQSDQ